MKVERWQLQQRQSYDLDLKIELSKVAIRNWYEYWNGDVSISFSGGKDSTVLLHLVRSIYPKVPAIFADTGLEYPEIRQFVKETENVIWVKPKMKFNDVIEKYGFPLISKLVSHQLRALQNPSPKNEATRRLSLTGIKRDGSKTKSFKLANRWHPLADANFKISDECCYHLKKRPLSKYKNPYSGVMASDSNQRNINYLEHGCNLFQSNKPISMPLGFWLESDVWEYIKTMNIPYSPIYDMGEKRTGCIFCMFGVHLEKSPNRFQRMQVHHPKLWDYCINTLNLRQPLDYIGVKYETERLPILDYI